MVDLKKIFNKRNVVIFSVLGGIAALWYIFSIISINDVVDAFKGATFELILYYILIQLGLIIVMTVRWRIILRSQGMKDVGIFRLTKYLLVGQAISFITPAAKLGGEPVRAALLSSKEGIPFDKSLSSVVIDKTLEISTSFAFFIIGSIIILFSFVISPNFTYIIVGLSIIFLFFLILFNYRVMRGKHFFLAFFQLIKLSKIKSLRTFMKKVKEFELLIIKFYHEDRKYFFYTIMISLVGWILMFFEYSVAAKMVGHNLSILQIFLVFTFVGAAYLVPVPMALGALEAGQVSVFSIINISAAAGLALSLIIRVKDMLITAIGLILLVIFGLNFKDAVNDAVYLDKHDEKLKKDEE